MPPPAVVEQQAKLGVSAEESKAQRLKRQQARFRDRGGIFVPSDSNPLIDILLSRTVSGESPSKARPKGVAAKRLSSARTLQASPTHRAGAAAVTEETCAVAGSSRSTSRKRKAKAVEPKADTTKKPAPKRRGRPAKGKRKAPDSDIEQPSPNTKLGSTSKEKENQRDAVPSTLDGNPKAKTKPQAKAKSSSVKKVVEVLVSDDDRTLVDVPHKAKSNPKWKMRYEDGESDDDAPVLRKRATPHMDNSKASGSKTAMRVNIEKNVSTAKKKMLGDVEERSRDEKYLKTTSKKRLPLRDDDAVVALAAEKEKAMDSTAAKSKDTTEPIPVPTCMSKDIKNGENSKATGKGKGKGRVEPDQDIVGPVDGNDDEPPPVGVTKPKKRKKEDDHDDRPRKVVKFSESGLPHSSSRKLKENQCDMKHNSAAKPSAKDKPDDVPQLKPTTKPPSRTRTSKGPPREVLERIKASAARHLRCADNEPDELDCLS